MDAPLGGGGWSVEAKAALDALTGLPFASISDAAGFLMLGSITKVAVVMKISRHAAPTVQPISSRVLPWIWAATRPFLARNLTRHHSSTPCTPTKTTSPSAKISQYSVFVSSALREPAPPSCASRPAEAVEETTSRAST